jgi:hypothetical protein
MYIENDIDIMYMSFGSFKDYVDYKVDVDNRVLDFECLYGNDTTATLFIPSGTMVDYVRFFKAIHHNVDYGKPVVIRETMYDAESQRDIKTLIVVQL